MASLKMTQANEQRTTNAVCICSKVCKNPKGLKIHQNGLSSEAMSDAIVLVDPAVEPGQKEDELSPESPHTTRNLRVTHVPPPGRKSDHRQVKWPVANSTEWTKVGEHVDKTLKSSRTETWSRTSKPRA